MCWCGVRVGGGGGFSLAVVSQMIVPLCTIATFSLVLRRAIRRSQSAPHMHVLVCFDGEGD